MSWLYIYVYFLIAIKMVKNPPVMQETWVWSLGREYPLEKEMAVDSSILARRIPWTEELGWVQLTCGYEVLKFLMTQFIRQEFTMSPDQQQAFLEYVFAFSLWL